MTIEILEKNGRKIYRVDVGTMPTEEAKKYLEKIKKEIEIKNDNI